MDQGTTGIQSNGTATADKPEFTVPESVREALEGKLQFAKQTQEMFNSARTQYQGFVDGIAAAVGVPAGYKLDADAMKFVPAAVPGEDEGAELE